MWNTKTLSFININHINMTTLRAKNLVRRGGLSRLSKMVKRLTVLVWSIDQYQSRLINWLDYHEFKSLDQILQSRETTPFDQYTLVTVTRFFSQCIVPFCRFCHDFSFWNKSFSNIWRYQCGTPALYFRLSDLLFPCIIKITRRNFDFWSHPKSMISEL